MGCEGGFYLATNSSGVATCPPCPEGCSSCTQKSGCEACTKGYIKRPNDTTCTRCPASCEECGYAPSGALECTSCPPRQLLVAPTRLCTGNGTCEHRGRVGATKGQWPHCSPFCALHGKLNCAPPPCFPPSMSAVYTLEKGMDYKDCTEMKWDVFDDSISCARACAGNAECTGAVFTSPLCSLKSGILGGGSCVGVPSGDSDTYIMLPSGSCPNGTHKDDSTCRLGECGV
jgi:hypothetical protein